MNVLIACERSQTILHELLKKDINAYSCDISTCRGSYPGRHIYHDVRDLIKDKNISFYTQDNQHHILDHWDMIIAHPPCTYLSKAGSSRLYHNGIIDIKRYEKGLKAKEFFMMFYNSNIEKICIENPVPLKIYQLPEYTQIIQPYEYGEPYSKATCLWLKNLPELKPTNIINQYSSWVYSKQCYKNRQYERSKTFKGIAEAISTQWF